MINGSINFYLRAAVKLICKNISMRINSKYNLAFCPWESSKRCLWVACILEDKDPQIFQEGALLQKITGSQKQKSEFEKKKKPFKINI